jgi:hypothetical protein
MQGTRKICGADETDNPDEICDDCKVSIISDDDIALNFYKLTLVCKYDEDAI